MARRTCRRDAHPRRIDKLYEGTVSTSAGIPASANAKARRGVRCLLVCGLRARSNLGHRQECLCYLRKSEGDFQGGVEFGHDGTRQMTELLRQSRLRNRAHLFAHRDRIFTKPAIAGADFNLTWVHADAVLSARDWDDHNDRTILVNCIAADDDHRTSPALLRAFCWIECGLVHVAPDHARFSKASQSLSPNSSEIAAVSR